MKYHYDVIQNTDEWKAFRARRVTASCASALLTDPKNKTYLDLVKRLAFERLTGEVAFQWGGNYYSNRGHELEPTAIKDYQLRSFNKVDLVGFVELDDFTGCSPDGLIGDNGLIQVKCPEWSAHIGLILKPEVPTAYMKQMQFELYVTGREYNIFYAYHPNLKPIIIEVLPVLEMQAQISERLALLREHVAGYMSIIK